MKLEKAIELLKVQIKIFDAMHQQDVIEAHKLGIAALKLVQELREAEIWPPGKTLPGETPE